MSSFGQDHPHSRSRACLYKTDQSPPRLSGLAAACHADGLAQSTARTALPPSRESGSRGRAGHHLEPQLCTKSSSPDAWPVRLRKIESAARFVSRYPRPGFARSVGIPIRQPARRLSRERGTAVGGRQQCCFAWKAAVCRCTPASRARQALGARSVPVLLLAQSSVLRPAQIQIQDRICMR
jgi:hypothetical protein